MTDHEGGPQIRLPEEQLPLRAKTYQPVAVGTCPFCKAVDVELRFVFDPYGRDQIMCVACGLDCDARYAEDANLSQATRELGDVFSEFRKTLVQKYGEDSEKVRGFDRNCRGGD